MKAGFYGLDRSGDVFLLGPCLRIAENWTSKRYRLQIRIIAGGSEEICFLLPMLRRFFASLRMTELVLLDVLRDAWRLR